MGREKWKSGWFFTFLFYNSRQWTKRQADRLIDKREAKKQMSRRRKTNTHTHTKTHTTRFYLNLTLKFYKHLVFCAQSRFSTVYKVFWWENIRNPSIIVSEPEQGKPLWCSLMKLVTMSKFHFYHTSIVTTSSGRHFQGMSENLLLFLLFVFYPLLCGRFTKPYVLYFRWKMWRNCLRFVFIYYLFSSKFAAV